MSRAPAQRSGAAPRHETFLLYGGQIHLKIAAVLSAAAIAVYILYRPMPSHSGGDWLGYTLGVISAGLIVWLTCLGIRKRAITPGRWSLKGWVSAHVYLGLSLIVLATLHTAFRFGWNIHTLAYGLMLLVIGSGLIGIYYYVTVPRMMSDNRDEKGGVQMIAEIAALDAELAEAARPISEADAAWVRRSIEARNFSRNVFVKLSNPQRNGANQQALEALKRAQGHAPGTDGEAANRTISLLQRKQSMLERARTHIRYKTLLELWLFVHVPMTFALLVALGVHILSVFYFW